VGALVASSFAASLRDDLGPAANRPAVSRAIDDAAQQPLARVSVPGGPPALRARLEEASLESSIDAFHLAIAIATGLVALGGLLGLAGLVNPSREVKACDCPGGQLVGATAEAARAS